LSLFVSRAARSELGLGPELVDSRGRLTLPSFTVARRLAVALAKGAATEERSAPTPSAGDVVALALLDDIYRALLSRYVRRRDPSVMLRALDHLTAAVGIGETLGTLEWFREEFGLRSAPLVAHADAGSDHRASGTAPRDARLLFEFALFFLQRRNPAASGLVSELQRNVVVSPVIERLFEEIEKFLCFCAGFAGESLAAELMAPFSAHPDSLSRQLEFLRAIWGESLGVELWRVQSALDLIAEETAPRWGSGDSPPPEAPQLPVDAEKKYSIDRDWMPRLVLAAKNTLVWMHQMSVAYGREISRLDEIPEEEMALLAGRGITGLWLIGLWDRSRASSEIKRRRGNPEAAASAYSLRGYRIAEEFGGDEALATLRWRAERHGVRLAADMVPNHMGIDSDWVLDHPERFVRVSEPPFPAYSFSGPDLSPRSDVGIFLEDHYYDNSDAAVVFRRLDRRTGEEVFIFHGNDGTSMPWNDTAQLDYLDGEVREAVIETILDVARRFPVIRFDAAMTLAKRHYHRLWHPQPGDAGAIPSRSEHSLSREALDELMPREFWREVVDRVSAEAPDTLLLAEAFWLMEGYFVRTLGLHLVYNSAFMHMMRDQETGKYRRLLKETLAFDPEILRRYVNFMSNPDEESAAEQFDFGDRYFGVCTVLATLPGLPMLAHGQWDGLREKYGMEYRRSYRAESPLREVIERHDREIAPILRQRALFAGVERFRLYDFVEASGVVVEDVLAYSNGYGDKAALVLFNNSPRPLTGRILESAPFQARAGDEALETASVLDELSLGCNGNTVNLLRDPIHHVSLMVPAESIGTVGLEVALGAFEVLVFEEFGQITDETASWSELANRLRGRHVDDPLRALITFRAEQMLAAVWRLADSLKPSMTALVKAEGENVEAPPASSLLEECGAEVDAELASYLSGPPFPSGSTDLQVDEGGPGRQLARALGRAVSELQESVAAELSELLGSRALVRCALTLAPVLELISKRMSGSLLDGDCDELFVSSAPLDAEARADVAAVLALARRENWLRPTPPPGVAELVAMTERWSSDREARHLLGVHDVDGTVWMVRERLDLLLAARRAFAVIGALSSQDEEIRREASMTGSGWRLASAALFRSASRADYRVEEWLADMRRPGADIDTTATPLQTGER
jgi:hypothetical protein